MEQEVIAFLHTHRKTKAIPLKPQTRLVQDMGLTRDEVEDLVRAFAEHFQVDMGAFRIAHYLGQQTPFNPFTWLWRALRHQEGFRPLTVAALARAAETKRWV